MTSDFSKKSTPLVVNNNLNLLAIQALLRNNQYLKY